MSYQPSLIEEVIEIGSEIKNLHIELAPLRDRVAQIEGRLQEEMSRLTALVNTGRSGATVADTSPLDERPKERKKRPFAGTGFIRTLLEFMKAHPNQEVTPESVAAAIGQPRRNGLAGTCLKRLCDAKVIDRPRNGHYVFRGPLDYYLPPKQPKEPAMT